MAKVTVDDVVEAIFQRFCDHQRAHGAGATASLAGAAARRSG
jgi:hypothetical protein